MRQELQRVQILLAHLCAMVDAFLKSDSKGTPGRAPLDFAPWFPRPEPAEGEEVEGAGLAAIMAAGHAERVARGEGG